MFFSRLRLSAHFHLFFTAACEFSCSALLKSVLQAYFHRSPFMHFYKFTRLFVILGGQQLELLGVR